MNLLRIHSKMITKVLIDLSGTLHIDNQAIPGAIAALDKLRKTNVQIQFVTNTTKESRNFLYNRLIKLGFQIEKNEIYSSLIAARQLIIDKQLKPMLFLEPEALEDFIDLQIKDDVVPNAVVIGLAPTEFHYDKLNIAFRYLLDGAQLIGIHCGKYYKRPDGLALGPGMFVKGLEYAANCTAIVVGKPNKAFFLSAIGDLSPGQVVMIGDDVNDDILGALSVGMRAILVQTGKYRDGDEKKIENCEFCPSFTEVVDKLIAEMISTE